MYIHGFTLVCIYIKNYVRACRAGGSRTVRGFQFFWCSGRSELLKIAQGALRAAQSRSESLRARPEPLRAAQNRPERSLRAAQGTAPNCSERAQSRSEPLRLAQSGRSEPLRAAQNRPELVEKPIGELDVTCTLHIRRTVLLDVVLSSPCMYMHGFTLA